MGWQDYGGIGYASGAIGAYGEDRPQADVLTQLLDPWELDANADLPAFLDQTPGVPSFVSETASVVSKNVGFDSTIVSWSSSKDFQAVRFEQVAGPAAAVFSGTLLASATGSPAPGNLVYNPSFEYDTIGSTTIPPTWNDNAGATPGSQLIVAGAMQGTRFLRYSYTNPDGVSHNAGIQQLTTMPVAVGQPYAVQALVNVAANAGIPLRLVVNWYDANSSFLAQSAVASASGIGSTTLSGVVTAPVGAMSATIALIMTVVTLGNSIQFDCDGISFANAATIPAYSDGDSANWGWSGTAGQSASYPTGRANVTYKTTLTGEAMSGTDGTDTIKIFVQDYAGNWST